MNFFALLTLLNYFSLLSDIRLCIQSRMGECVGDCVITCVTLIFCQQRYRGDTNLYMIDVTFNNLFASA